MKGLRNVWIVIIMCILLASSVSALNGCCERTLDGEYCMQTNDANCDSESGYQFVPTSCESTSFCKLGCCYSSDSGRCFKNSPRAACNAIDGATFSGSADCEIAQCKQGCCVIGDQAFFVTQVQCKKTASLYPDVEMQFDEDVDSEMECIQQTENMDEGCCVKNDGTCLFTTKGACPSAGAIKSINDTLDSKVGFYKDMLCSNDKLECDCAKQQTTRCIGEDLYWVDSCGNRENIYSSDKPGSYNGGYVLKEEDSCVISGANDANCGNCNYPAGTVCGEDKEKEMPVGDYTCISLGCKEVYDDVYSPSSGGEKKNGESWCIYDSQVGLGRDLAGSRHYRHICINGEEIVESCKDYREEICVQGVLGKEVLDNLNSFLLASGEYTESACRSNRWADCDACNTLTQLPGKPDEEDIDKGERQPEALIALKIDCCNNEDVRDCYWMEAGITDAGGVCVPMVPPGLKHWGAQSATATANTATAAASGATTTTSSTPAEQTCAQANQECKVVYRIGGWSRLLRRSDKEKAHAEIIKNKVCTTKNWVIAGNNFCKAQGDCGAYFNILGVATGDGYINTLAFEDDYLDGSSRSLDESDYGDFRTLVSRPNDKKLSKNDMLLKDPGLWTAVIGGASSFILGAAGPAGVGGNNSWYAGGAKGIVGGLSSLFNWGEKCTPAKKAAKKAASTPSSGSSSSTSPPSTPSSGSSSSTSPPSTPSSGSSSSTSSSVPSSDITKNVPSSLMPTLSATGIDAITGATIFPTQVPGQFYGDSGPLGALINIVGSKAGIGGQILAAGVRKASQASSGGSKTSNAGGSKTSSAAKSAVCAKGFAGKAKSIYAGGSFGSIVNLAAWGAAIYTTVEYTLQKERTQTYKIICKPWQAPAGSNDCEKCNDPMKPCSEYRCKSLGQNCGIVNAGTDEAKCITLDVNDVNSPKIFPSESLMLPYTIEEVTEEGHKGFKINEKIAPFSPVLLAILTDEPAQCKYAFEPSIPYEKMADTFGSSMYLYNQTLRFAMPSQFANKNLTTRNSGEYSIFVKCQDANGNKNANDQDFFIKFMVDDSPDLTPPIIRFTNLENEAYIGYNETEINFNVYVNEPSECRWSRRDTGYDQMENEFDCEDNEMAQSVEYLATYECLTRLQNLTRKENNFYIKCKDKPGAEDDERNVNEDSYKFTLKGTQELLELVSFGPSGKLYTKDIIMQAVTKGGVENGKAICAFSNADVSYSEMIVFGTTDSTISEQEMAALPQGNYKYYFSCMDLGGNMANDIIEFEIDVDEYPPEIVSLYADAWVNKIYLEMNEKTTCEYMDDESFVFGEGVRFAGTNETMLSTDWATGTAATLNVLCRDKYGNEAHFELHV